MTAADTRVVMALVVLVVVARGADRGGDGGGHGADPLVNGTLRATNDVTSGVSWRQMAGCDQAFRGGNRGFVGRAYRIRTQYRPPSKTPGQAGGFVFGRQRLITGLRRGRLSLAATNLPSRCHMPEIDRRWSWARALEIRTGVREGPPVVVQRPYRCPTPVRNSHRCLVERAAPNGLQPKVRTATAARVDRTRRGTTLRQRWSLSTPRGRCSRSERGSEPADPAHPHPVLLVQVETR